MKKIITTIILASAALLVNAQQDVQITQFTHNKLFFNPAYAGVRLANCFTAIGRQQWSGFDGSPRSAVLSFDSYQQKLHGGIGGNIMYDQLGFETNLRYNFSYSFHLFSLEKGILAFGIEAGGYSKRIGPSSGEQWISTTNWQNDGSIPPLLKSSRFDLGLGLWYESDKLWMGISASHLPAQSMTAIASNGQTMSYAVARHYFLTGGYRVKISDQWELRPAFLLKSDGTITSADINATVLFNEQFWFGASWRIKDAVCPSVGFQKGKLKIGFAYDHTTTALRNYNNGTFELFLNYCFPPGFGGGRDVRIFN
jgi:type IX secretion system PorP/SprF family membrane protein